MALTSCVPSSYKDAKTTDVEQVKVETEATCTLLNVFKVEYSGHSYIMFDGSNHLNGIIHDPDCSCHKVPESDFGF